MDVCRVILFFRTMLLIAGDAMTSMIILATFCGHWPIGKRSKETQFAGKRGGTKLFHFSDKLGLHCIALVIKLVVTFHEFKLMASDAYK